ncbi:MAG TPA: UDP-N-acetylmuramate--L-alanine ligase [Flavobacteriales bacterium]|nr:UDP-N-acetylmuramate--L-alanine ligase [Flavobacteriales bacterium]
MMNNVKIVYLLGIGGIGMSALARYFNHFGCSVSGYDKTSTTLTDKLQSEGINIHFEDSIELMPAELVAGKVNDDILVIYTPAIPKGHKQYNYLLEKGFKLLKRSEVLGEITKNANSIAVAGTHGKTTTSTLVAHILKHAGNKVNAFLGGISGNYNTNLLLAENATQTVIEADEYDRSFLRLFPDVAVITSMDPDHLDIYGDEKEMVKSYNEFALQVKSTGILFYRYGLPVSNAKNAFTYGFEKEADYYAHNIKITNGEYTFDLKTPSSLINNIGVGLPGRHNVENATAAFAVSLHEKLDIEKIKEGIKTYKGAKRRFDYVIKENNLVFIDDYAHHPAELSACISSVKEMYPGKKVLGVFQPHLFTRTRDFADDFAKSLDLLDEVVLMEIYPARELPIEGVTSQMLLDKVHNKNKSIKTREEIPTYVKSRKADIVVTLGAGDIDKLVEPIRKELQG